MLTHWSYWKRWGDGRRGEPLKVVGVYRQSDRGKYQVGHRGRWTTVPQPWTHPDRDTMYDSIPLLEGLALAKSLTSSHPT